MEIRRLGYFVQIAELGSLGRAAEVLRIAQPALTRQVRLLEQELGVSLFTRTRRGMRLTEAGEQLHANVAGPLRQLDVALQNARSSSSSITGNIVVGMPATTAYALAQPLLERVIVEQPDITLRIVEGASIHLLDWLVAGEIDMAIFYGPCPIDKLRERILLSDDFALVGSAHSGLSPDQPIAFQHITALPFIVPSPRSDVRAIARRPVAKLDTELNVKYVVDSFQVTKGMVEKGEGYTILPISSILNEFESGRLKYAPIHQPLFTRQLILATKPYYRVPRIMSKVEQIIQQVIMDLYALGKLRGVTKIHDFNSK